MSARRIGLLVMGTLAVIRRSLTCQRIIAAAHDIWWRVRRESVHPPQLLPSRSFGDKPQGGNASPCLSTGTARDGCGSSGRPQTRGQQDHGDQGDDETANQAEA